MSGYSMRSGCKLCGCTTGYIETRNGQDCVFCGNCRRFQYNAPKVETNRETRSVTTVHNGISPKVRARVLERATGRCELCGSKDNLHVGHLISVDAGFKHGLSDAEINSDENLAAMCAECNLGIGATPVPLRLAVAMVMVRVRRNSPE